MVNTNQDDFERNHQQSRTGFVTGHSCFTKQRSWLHSSANCFNNAGPPKVPVGELEWFTMVHPRNPRKSQTGNPGFAKMPFWWHRMYHTKGWKVFFVRRPLSSVPVGWDPNVQKRRFAFLFLVYDTFHSTFLVISCFLTSMSWFRAHFRNQKPAIYVNQRPVYKIQIKSSYHLVNIYMDIVSINHLVWWFSYSKAPATYDCLFQSPQLVFCSTHPDAHWERTTSAWHPRFNS